MASRLHWRLATLVLLEIGWTKQATGSVVGKASVAVDSEGRMVSAAVGKIQDAVLRSVEDDVPSGSVSSSSIEPKPVELDSRGKCTMTKESQMMRMAYYAYQVGIFPLGGTSAKSGHFSADWELEEFSFDPFMGSFGEFWVATGMAGSPDNLVDCGWKQEIVGCLRGFHRNITCQKGRETIEKHTDYKGGPNSENDYLIIYKNEKGNHIIPAKSCAVSFSGSNGEDDWVNNKLWKLDVRERLGHNHKTGDGNRTLRTRPAGKWTHQGDKKNKFGIYGGYIAEYEEFQRAPEFQEWLELANSNECEHIFISGHSLGGAMSEVHRLDLSDVDAPINGRLTGTLKQTCLGGKPCQLYGWGNAPPFFSNPNADAPGKPQAEAPRFGETCGATNDRVVYMQADEVPTKWMHAGHEGFEESFGKDIMLSFTHGTNLPMFKLYRSIAREKSPPWSSRILITTCKLACEITPWQENKGGQDLSWEGHSIRVYPGMVDMVDGIMWSSAGAKGNHTPQWFETHEKDYVLSKDVPGSLEHIAFFMEHLPRGMIQILLHAPYRIFHGLKQFIR